MPPRPLFTESIGGGATGGAERVMYGDAAAAIAAASTAGPGAASAGTAACLGTGSSAGGTLALGSAALEALNRRAPLSEAATDCAAERMGDAGGTISSAPDGASDSPPSSSDSANAAATPQHTHTHTHSHRTSTPTQDELTSVQHIDVIIVNLVAVASVHSKTCPHSTITRATDHSVPWRQIAHRLPR